MINFLLEKENAKKTSMPKEKMLVTSVFPPFSQKYFQKASRPVHFRLAQIETNCRRHSKVHLKWKINNI